MDKNVELTIIVTVGVLSGIALLVGQNEMATAGVAGLIGYLGKSVVDSNSGSA